MRWWLAVVACGPRAAEPAPLPPAPPAVRTLQLDVGRQCAGPPPGVPATPGDVTRALRRAGVRILAKGELARCEACGCPVVSVQVQVPEAHAARVERIAARWGR